MGSVVAYFKNLTPAKILRLVVLVVVFLVAIVGRRWWYLKGETVSSLSQELQAAQIEVTAAYFAPDAVSPEERVYTVPADSQEGATLLKVLRDLRFHDFPAGILPRNEDRALKEGQYAYTLRLVAADGDFFLVGFRAADWRVANAEKTVPMSVPQGKDIGNTLGVLLWLYSENNS